MKCLLAENGWQDITDSPTDTKHAKRLMRGKIEDYSHEAAMMTKYLGEFVTLKCAPDMLKMRLFPNGKEISESFGAYNAVRYKLQQFKLNDPGITIVAVGDGHTPRTAATFALRSAWTCHSVDPNLKGGTVRWSGFDRLTIHSKKIEDCSFKADRVILVAVHSHAKLDAALAVIEAKEIAVVAMPCCVPQKLGTLPDKEYQDTAVISPCRTIKIWNNVVK